MVKKDKQTNKTGIFKTPYFFMKTADNACSSNNITYFTVYRASVGFIECSSLMQPRGVIEINQI